MNLGDARTEVRARGFDYLSDTRLDFFLNYAKDEIETLADWPWLETTTTDTAPLTISDLKHVLYVVDTSNRTELMGVQALDIVRELDADVDATGTPMVWWLDGLTTLKLYPTNASVNLSVRYVKVSPTLDAADETPLIPSKHHQVWIDTAVKEAYQDSDNFEAAQQLQQSIDRGIGRMLEEYETRNRQNPMYQLVSPDSLLWGDW